MTDEKWKARARELLDLITAACTCDLCIDAAAAALAEAAAEENEQCARIFNEKMRVHIEAAIWQDAHGKNYRGAPADGISLSPSNGPAFAYLREKANAAAIRARGRSTVEKEMDKKRRREKEQKP